MTEPAGPPALPPANASEGDRLGAYVLKQEIGRGTSSIVHEVVHEPSGNAFAMKRPKRVNADSVARLRREARVLALLDHPNVVRLVDYVADGDGAPYLVLELLRGQLFSATLSTVRRLPIEETAALLLPVVSAVGKAHALGVLHRDLKLENLLYTMDDIVKVLDFGVAKLGAASGLGQATSQLTVRGTAIGTPYSMSPEQAFGEDVDHRTDIWSLGVILYQCLSGRRPVEGRDMAQILRILETGAIAPLRAVAPDVPADVAELVRAALQRDVRHRPSSLQSFHDVLRRYATVAVPPFEEPAEMERPSIA